MNYTERVNNLLGKPIEAIIASVDCLELIQCYSDIYLSGGHCPGCERSQRKYYSQLQYDGLTKAKAMDEKKPRTCKPNWGKGCTNNNGLKYIHKEGAHYSSLHITDEQALSLLNRGLLLESDFDILPEGYQPKLEKFPETPTPKKAGRKPKA